AAPGRCEGVAGPPASTARPPAFLAPLFYETRPAGSPALDAARRDSPDFDQWVRANVVEHRVPGYAIANLSLKDPAQAPGDLTADQMDQVADLAEHFSFGELRVSHRQNLVFPDVRQDELHALWQALAAIGLATPNLGRVTDIIACPGLDYCALANARSIPVAQAIQQEVAQLDLDAIGELTVNISGCMNACGHHHVGHIGILGVDKGGREYYQFTLGGSSDQQASLGERLGPAVAFEQVPGAIRALVECYQSIREPGERFLDTVRRIGVEPFRDAVYGQGRGTRQREVA
ncbi:MAG: nitrite/sulfite reductase, partial [Chromatiales bacterium]|nr:nitrite/sulfite reductase [Chromatiales bacterium]